MGAVDYPPPALPPGCTGPEAAQAMLLWAYGCLDQIQAYFDTYGYDEDRDADTIEQVRCLTDVAHIYRDWKRGVASDSDTAWRIRGIAARFSE